MIQQDHEYKGLLASSWDLLRGDTSDWPDRPFYRDIILKDGQPALDFGCGTGRLLLDYLSQGLDVEGVDNSPDMLAICRQKAESLDLRPNLYEQAVQSLDLPREYRIIFVPSSSFQLLTDLDDAMQTLRLFYRHLLPEGILVMSIMDISSFASEEWTLVSEDIRPEDELLVRRWEWSRYDPGTQLEHTQNRFELLKDGEVIYSELHRQSPATRHYELAQITPMMEAAGFVKIRAVSGFSHEPVSAEDDVFCIFGTHP